MLGTDCNYFLGNTNCCFIWNEFSDNIHAESTVWNEFSDKIKYYYSKSSYNIKSLAHHFYVKTKILEDFHICIFVAFNCSLHSLRACSIQYVVFTSIQWYMYS